MQENSKQVERAESEGIHAIVIQAAVQAATAEMMVLRDTDKEP